ncbi:MAG TPA: hypothetical protein VGK30_08900 [Candidatus Binatia bacterium]|jgi:ElaB/YqjD/DUF883 family membrane-anchored ribosome-binding protein
MHTSEHSWADEAGSGIGGDYGGDGRDRLKDAGETLSAIDTEVRAFVKENPFVALAAAVVGGFMIGRILSRL